jgi:hypothetical protein
MVYAPAVVVLELSGHCARWIGKGQNQPMGHAGHTLERPVALVGLNEPVGHALHTLDPSALA